LNLLWEVDAVKGHCKNRWKGMFILLGSLSVAGSVFANDGASAAITPELTARWWQWALSIPSSVHPLSPISDPTGAKYCMVGQQGDEWFLGGVFKTVDTSAASRRAQSKGNAGTLTVQEFTRECNDIPLGKSILIAVINGECSTAEELALGNKVPADLYAKTRYLRNCAKKQADAMVPPGAGKNAARAYFGPVDSMRNPVEVKRVYTLVPFSVTYSPDNILSSNCGMPPSDDFLCAPKPNPSLAQADGYWARVRAQEAGKYKLVTFGAAPGFDFALRITYTLTFVAPRDQ
jgi:hypothetical protein